MARGSLYEVEAQLLVATDLGFANTESVQSITDLLTKMARMLSGLIRYNADRIQSEKGMEIRESAEEYGKAENGESDFLDPRFPSTDY